MVNIENKCRESMDESIANINIENDQDSVVERLDKYYTNVSYDNIILSRYKTGDLPPHDFQFEEMSVARGKRSSSLTRMSKRLTTTTTGEKHNHFQKKRNLLKNIESHRNAITKGG